MNLNDLSDVFSKFVGDRPVGFICHGHSLSEFSKHRYALRNRGFVWGSLNQYWIAENVLKGSLDFVVFQSGAYRDFWHHGMILNWDRLEDRDRRKSTLFEFLELCIKAKIKKVILFGADGYSESEDKYFSVANPNQYIGHKQDCENFNKLFPEDHGDTEIFNCSINSHYQNIKKVPYEYILDRF